MIQFTKSYIESICTKSGMGAQTVFRKSRAAADRGCTCDPNFSFGLSRARTFQV